MHSMGNVINNTPSTLTFPRLSQVPNLGYTDLGAQVNFKSLKDNALFQCCQRYATDNDDNI